MSDGRKRTALDNSMPHFPEDVLITVFLKLPVRSLFLFRSVCKYWLRLIESPDFILLHYNRPVDNEIDPMLVLHFTKKPNYQVRSVLAMLSGEETLVLSDDVASEFLLPGSNNCIKLLGPCNGLFYIKKFGSTLLVNPANRKFRRLPHAPFCYERDITSQFVDNIHAYYDSFGFDPVSNDYKVVHIKFATISVDFDDDYGGKSDDTLKHHHFKVWIFKLSSNSWREIVRVVPIGMSRLYGYSCFCNGAVHFLGGDKKGVLSILVFDLNKEVFKEFELPVYYYANNLSLSILHESLTLVVHRRCFYDQKIDIWVMEKYGINESWINLYKFSSGMTIKRPLSFGKDREFLVENSDGKLVSYNLNTRATKELDIHGVAGHMYAFRYRESLISLR